MRAYIVKPDDYKWIALYSDGNSVTYFVSFSVEHIPEEIKGFIGNKNIIRNIFRIQANHLCSMAKVNE